MYIYMYSYSKIHIIYYIKDAHYLLRWGQFLVVVRVGELCLSVKTTLSEKRGGLGQRPKEAKRFLYHCQKKTKTKNLMSVGRRRLLQLYWYKAPVLHSIKYHLMSEL